MTTPLPNDLTAMCNFVETAKVTRLVMNLNHFNEITITCTIVDGTIAAINC